MIARCLYFDEYSDGLCCYIFSMVVLRRRPVGSSGAREGSGLCSGVGQLDNQMREFISSEIKRSILEQTPMIFGSFKEGILEILDERLSAFRAGIVALFRTHSLTFKELW